MKIKIPFSGKDYLVDLSKGKDISIRLNPFSEDQLKAWWAPDAMAYPEQVGDFILSVSEGSPVNSYTLKVNIHGSTTHTETLGHINKKLYPISKALTKHFFITQVITASPSVLNQDRVVDDEAFPTSQLEKNAEALVIRTLPNGKWKRKMDYSGQNACYFDPFWVKKVLDNGIEHLLVDTPSVDREEDGGKLASHHMFWSEDVRNPLTRTITELIYVPKGVKDGLYLLNLCPINIKLDAGISRPVLYKMKTTSS